MRLNRTSKPSSSSRIAIVRAVSRQIPAWSSLFAMTWTRLPSPPRRSHSASPAISVVFPLPLATCTIARRMRRRPSAARQPTI
jgi:hypothetical protein